MRITHGRFLRARHGRSPHYLYVHILLPGTQVHVHAKLHVV